MHRATPSSTSFRGYTAGGARTLIDKVDDERLMQEMSGNFMKGETRKEVEAPQNYGFTSLVMPADKGEDGQIEQGAEGFVSFMGGNRSFPVCTVMDDRRHRLKSDGEKKMEPGDSAMYRTKDDRQQFHLHKDGNYLSCRDDRVNRIALVPKPDDAQKQGGGGVVPQAQATAAGGTTAAGQGQQQQQKKKPTGQTHMLKENKESKVYFEQNGSENIIEHNQAFNSQRGGSDSSTFFEDRKKSTQATAEHTHLRTEEMRIFTDPYGCWSEVPMMVKKDRYCKD